MKTKKFNLYFTKMQTRMINDYVEYINATDPQACPCKNTILFNILFKEFKQDEGFNKYVKEIKEGGKDIEYLIFKSMVGMLQ